MKNLKLKGSYYEMGAQLGKMIKGRLELPEPDNKKQEWVLNCERVMNQYTPELLEEIQGITDAANLEKTRFNAIILYDFSFIKNFYTATSPIQRCTIFTIPRQHTETGKPVIARNYDWLTEVQEYFAMHQIHPTKKERNVLFTDHYVGGYGGVNEAGLACGLTAAAYYNGDIKPAMMLNMTMRWMLDSFQNTEDAVAFLEEVPHSEGIIYLIADKHGVSARVEASPDKVFTTYAQDEFLIATNHFQSKEMQQLENKITEANAHTTITRLEGISHWYYTQKKPVTIDSIKSILKDHEYGVCDHQQGVSYNEDGNREEEDIAGTLWSWIATLGTNEVEICVGSPCKNDYMVDTWLNQ
ncbi:MAG: C45 family autoproteolytic acyltransferase/hydrolase [Candidatus Hermodarchaeota archaeon]